MAMAAARQKFQVDMKAIIYMLVIVAFGHRIAAR